MAPGANTGRTRVNLAPLGSVSHDIQPAAKASRPRLRLNTGVIFDGMSVTVLIGLVMVAFATFRDYGITWDETWHQDYGQYIVEWYATGFQDRTALSYRGDFLYGGGFDALGGFLVRAIPMEGHETIHLFGSMIGIVGVVGAWKLGRRLAGPAGGLWTVVLLVSTPVYYGHMFNNPKDLPFAAGYVWALYYLVGVAGSLPRVGRAQWIKLSLASGAGLSVRVGGLLLHCYMLALIAGFTATVYLHTRAPTVARALAWRLFKRFLAVLGGAWVVMLVFWPWAILDPIRRPFFALGRMTRFNLHMRKMPFGDEEIWTYDVPWDYLVRYFGLKIPEPVLILSLVALVVAIRHAVRHYRQSAAIPRLMRDGVVTLAILFPPVYALALGSTLYDGLRHFLFLVPPLCAVSAATLVGGISRLRATTRMPRWMPKRGPGWLLGAGVAAACAGQVRTMWHLHPHQYVYFNRIAGGLPGVYNRYDTDYYGNGYKEAVRLLQERLWETEKDTYLHWRYRLKGCIPSFIAKQYLPAHFIWNKRGSKKARAHFYLGYQRAGCHEKHTHRPIFTQVERQGTPLIIVRDMRTDADKVRHENWLERKKNKRRKNRRKKNNKKPPPGPKGAADHAAQTSQPGRPHLPTRPAAPRGPSPGAPP